MKQKEKVKSFFSDEWKKYADFSQYSAGECFLGVDKIRL